MKSSLVVGLMAALLGPSLFAPAAVQGQVISATVGVQPKCPYGLSVCWPEAHDGLSLMNGVQFVDRQPSLETWTGTVRTRDGGLPNPAAWSREFKDIVGGTFGFRGVEITVEGDLIEVEGRVALKVPGSRTPLRLTPLSRKVQWDPERKCEQAATDLERTAYRRLVDRARESVPGPTRRIRIVGPLDDTAPAEQPILGVRDFTWR